MYRLTSAISDGRMPHEPTAEGSALSKLSRLAIAVCISGMASSAAHATAGAVDAAPIAVEPAPIVKRDVSSLAGFYLAGRQAGITKDLSAAAGFYTAALDKDPGNLLAAERFCPQERDAATQKWRHLRG